MNQTLVNIGEALNSSINITGDPLVVDPYTRIIHVCTNPEYTLFFAVNVIFIMLTRLHVRYGIFRDFFGSNEETARSMLKIAFYLNLMMLLINVLTPIFG